MADIVHGTYSGWNAHKRRSEPPCLDCKEAQRQYQAERRLNNDKRQMDRELVKAADAALRRLAKLHPEEYRQLYEYYKAKIRSEKPMTAAELNKQVRKETT